MASQSAFKALSDPTRRAILRLLADGSMSAGAIAEHFDMSRPSLSHHFSLLKQADLVRTQRDGQSIVYTLNTSVVEDTARMLFDLAGVADGSDAGVLSPKSDSQGST